VRRLLHGWTLRIAVPVAVTLALAASGLAYFTSHGSGSASAGIGTLAAASITSASPGAGTVALSWSTVTPPASGTVTYYVLRDGVAPGGNCPTSGSPTTATNCTDSGLPAGSHSYTVTAKWHSWTAMSSTTNVTLTSGAASQIVLSSATGNLASGMDRTLTATIKDAVGNTVTSGADSTASIAFAQMSGPGSVSGTGNATASAGVATKTVTGNLAGAVTLQASATLIAGATSSNALGFTVTFGAASQLVLSGSSSGDLTAGVTRTLTATVEDAAGNTVTSGGDSSPTINFAQSSGSGSVTGTGDATASGGVATKIVTGNVVGSVSLQASAMLSIAGLTFSNSLTFSVVVGAADHIDLTGSTSDLTAGATRPLTATIKDVAGNTRAGDSSTVVTFAKTAGAGTVSGLSTATASSGVAAETVTGGLAGSITLAATATGIPAGTTLTFNVVTGAADHVDLTGSTADLTWGGTRLLTATIKDVGGNTVTTDTSTVVTFAKTAGTGTVTGLGSATVVSGVASKTVTGAAVGSITLSASATGLSTGTTLAFNVVAGGTCNWTGTTSANWDAAPTNWSCGHIPTATDAVTIVPTTNNIIVTVANSAVAASIVLGNQTTSTTTTLTINGTNLLSVGSDVTIYTPRTSNNRSLNVNAGSLAVGGALSILYPGTFDAGNAAFIGRLAITTGTAGVGGDLVFNVPVAAQAQVVMSGGAGFFNLGGTLNATNQAATAAGTLTPGTTSTFNFNGTTAQTVPIGVSSIVYNNLTVSNTSVTGTTLSAAVTSSNVTGDVTIASASTLNAGSVTHSLAGSFTNNGTFNAGASTMTFVGTTAESVGGTSSTTFNNLTINSTNTLTLGTNGSVVGNLTVSGGTFDLGSRTIDRTAAGGTLSVGAAATLSIGGSNGIPANYSTHTFNATSTVNYSGTGAQTIAAENYGNLTISGARTTNSVTLASSGTIGVAGAVATTATFAGGAYVTTGSTVNFNSTSTQNVTQPAFSYNNLTVSGGSTKTATQALTVNNDFTIAASTTFAAGALSHSIKGNFFNNGTAFTPGTSTVTFNGTSAQSIGGSTATTFNSLTINKSSGTATLASTATAAVLSVSAGTFDLSTQTLSVTGATTISAPATLTQGAGTLNQAGATTVNGTLAEAGGTLLAASTITVTNGGTINLTSGTIHLATALATAPTDALTINAGGTMTQSGGSVDEKDFTVVAGGSYTQSSGTFRSYHDFKNAGTFNATGGIFEIAGTGAGNAFNSPGTNQFFNVVVDAGITAAFDSNVAAAIGVRGDWTNNGTVTLIGAATTVTFNGSGAQTIGGSAATTFLNLTISNSIGSVSLSGVDATATGTLALGSSVLTTGSRKMVVTTTTPTRTSGYVNGALQRAGSVSTMIFAVGNGTNDTTVNAVINTCTSCTLTVRSTAGEHPNVATSGIKSTTDVNTYWTLASTGTITFGAVTFTYPSGNVDAGTTFGVGTLVKRWVSPNWSAVTVSGTPSNTSTSVTGVTSANLGDFIIGNP
jgi:hypothetical protein